MCIQDPEGTYCAAKFDALEADGTIASTPEDTFSSGDLCAADLCEREASKGLLNMGCCMGTTVFIFKKYAHLFPSAAKGLPVLTQWSTRCMGFVDGVNEVCEDPRVQLEAKVVMATVVAGAECQQVDLSLKERRLKKSLMALRAAKGTSLSKGFTVWGCKSATCGGRRLAAQDDKLLVSVTVTAPKGADSAASEALIRERVEEAKLGLVAVEEEAVAEAKEQEAARTTSAAVALAALCLG